MIPLYVRDGVAYVWNSDDWCTLRSRYRICGTLMGSVPSFPRQNDFSGLPMALMSEEASLLVDKGICQLFELTGITNTPSEEDKETIRNFEERVLVEQTHELKRRKIEQLSQKIDIIVAGKKQKLLAKGITDTTVLNKQVLLEDEINKLPKLAPAHVLVHLPTQHFMNGEKKKVTTDVLQPNMTNENECDKYTIFKNLWEKGFHITKGTKFGSDYLLYPGDPVKFHATYMVRCISHNTSFLPCNLVAFGRLSVAVNKLALLAYCNSYRDIQYQTLQWHDSVTV